MKSFLIMSLVLALGLTATSTNYNLVQYITLGANTYPQSPRVLNSCINGYYWTGQTCMPCAQLSNSSSGYNKCTNYGGTGELVCNSGYTLISGSCIQIPTGCLTYGLNPNNNSFICNSCYTNYSLISGVCIPSNNCTTYNPLTAVCSSCADGYYFSWDLQYSSSITNQWNTYYLSLQSFCQQCGISNCASCSSGYTCTTCAPNYYWQPSTSTSVISSQTSADAGQCASCMTGCKTCTNSSNCTACQNDHYLVSATGSANPTCTLCSTAITNCAICSSGTTCTTCQSGYYLYSANQCVSLGQFCTAATPTVNCTKCQTNFLLDTVLNQCVSCPTGCTTCAFLSGTSGTVNCSQCSDLYYGVKNTTTGQVTCSSCSQGNSSWLRCQGPVESASLSAAQPTQCTNGNYLIDVAATGTVAATVTCISSTVANPCLTASISTTNTLTCVTCVTNYNLYTGGQCYSCPPQSGSATTLSTGCNQCTTSGTLTCTGCATGYYFTASTATCTACGVGCSTCTANGCTQCSSYYYLTGGQCNACVANCISCTSATNCTSCTTGFFLTSSTTGTTTTSACYACQPNCSTCSSPGQVCQSCSTSTTTGLTAYVSQQSGCVPLAQANCYTAGSSGCSLCNYGFYFQNNYCLQCIQPYAGFVCNQTLVNNNGVSPTPSNNGYIMSILALIVLVMGI